MRVELQVRYRRFNPKHSRARLVAASTPTVIEAITSSASRRTGYKDAWWPALGHARQGIGLAAARPLHEAPRGSAKLPRQAVQHGGEEPAWKPPSRGGFDGQVPRTRLELRKVVEQHEVGLDDLVEDIQAEDWL